MDFFKISAELQGTILLFGKQQKDKNLIKEHFFSLTWKWKEKNILFFTNNEKNKEKSQSKVLLNQGIYLIFPNPFSAGKIDLYSLVAQVINSSTCLRHFYEWQLSGFLSISFHQRILIMKTIFTIFFSLINETFVILVFLKFKGANFFFVQT